MVQRSGFAPKSLGVIVDDKHDSVMLPDVDEETVIYHVQEFQPMGKSCWSLLQERRQKRKVDEAGHCGTRESDGCSLPPP